MRFVTTCLFGLERLAGEDIDALGYKRIETTDGRVEFEAPADAIARCNVNFRYSERVLIKLGAFGAETFDGLFENTRALPWEDLIGRDDAFPVKGHSVKSRLFSVPDCQAIIKKAVCRRLGSIYGMERLPETGVKKQIVFFLMNDTAHLMIDTTGEGLHKRGYRPAANLAPIRETLAAAMVNFSRPRANVLTVDPMCGSGTIAIEAALLASNTAPGMNRAFSAERYGLLPENAFELAREEARAKVTEPQMRIFGSDIDKDSLDIARENARRAGVEKWVDFSCADVRSFVPPVEGARGTIVCNPPYGERMMYKESAAELIAAAGKAIARSAPMWQLYFISPDPLFERHFGRRADKVRTLYNGTIKCGFYQFYKQKT